MNRKNLGAFLWFFSIQYFIVEAIVQYGWNVLQKVAPVYSMRFNYISDLGASACVYFPKDSSMFVCSPLHVLMNASFILNGVLAIVGSFLLQDYFKNKYKEGSTFIQIGLNLILIGSIGNISVGFFPENTILLIHELSAVLLFVLTNIGLICVGTGMAHSGYTKKMSLYTIGSGALALCALFILATKLYYPFGIGLVERAVAYPLTVWLIVMSVTILLYQNHR